MTPLAARLASLALLIGAGLAVAPVAPVTPVAPVAPVAAAQDARCGAPDTPCEIAAGSYNVSLPEGWSGGPAVIHLHGYGGSGARVVGNTAFAARINARGYALIAPTGLAPYAQAPGKHDWAVRDGGTYARDDIAFLRAVLADAAARFGIDRSRVLMTGFSRGGSMVWDVACLAPDTAAAYAPASGGFWAPFPQTCTAPVKLFHTHGFTDRVVPLEGRSMDWGGATFTQSDIYRGLRLWRRVNGCGSRAGKHLIGAKVWRKAWTDCLPGAALEFALHAGGHGLPKGWSAMVLDWFEAVARGN